MLAVWDFSAAAGIWGAKAFTYKVKSAMVREMLVSRVVRDSTAIYKEPENRYVFGQVIDCIRGGSGQLDSIEFRVGPDSIADYTYGPSGKALLARDASGGVKSITWQFYRNGELSNSMRNEFSPPIFGLDSDTLLFDGTPNTGAADYYNQFIGMTLIREQVAGLENSDWVDYAFDTVTAVDDSTLVHIKKEWDFSSDS
jgi:hypothetical protein